MYRLLGVVALVTLCAALFVSVAVAHEGNPNYRSNVDEIRPAPPGLSAQILNYDDRVELVNESDEMVTVKGYEGEPYVRLWPDGRVEVNQRSPATYLNEDRFAQVTVPPEAGPDATPDWELVGRTGRFEWHDHRVHWMSEGTRPPQITDEKARTKIFDWRVPVTVGGRGGAITGELLWVGLPGGGFPLAAALSLIAVAAAGLGAVLVVRRRRRRTAAARVGSGREAWWSATRALEAAATCSEARLAGPRPGWWPDARRQV